MPQNTALPLDGTATQADLQRRLTRIQGQLQGIARMVQQQRPCIEVLQQLASVQAALKGVTKAVLRNYLQRCATQAIRSGDENVYDELIDAIFKFAR